MAKRVGFDDGDTEEFGVGRHLFHFFSWCLKSLFTRAFDFGGRTGRGIFLIQFVFIIALIVMIFRVRLLPGQEPFEDPIATIVYLGGLYLTLTLIIRRAHDVGDSAWTYLNIFSPYSTAFKWLGLFAKSGDKGPNEYGNPPFIPKTQEKIDPKRIG